MPIAAPLLLHRDIVRPDWIDRNAHMNVAYYLLAFDRAGDAFLDYIGMDEDYRARFGGTTFAVDCHLSYRREVSEGAPLRFAAQLLAFDRKRIHHFHWMYHAEEDYLAATCEFLSLHVDLGTRRVAPFPPRIANRLADIMASHRGLPTPPEAGRSIAMPLAKAVPA